MRSRTVGTIILEFNPREHQTADLISGACERAIELAQLHWGLAPPQECRIYVMTSWLGFVFHSAPWSWRILLGATMPFWCLRAWRTWPYSAAWTQRYGRKVAIGVKPPRLLAQSDRRIGTQIYVEEKNMDVNVQHVTCHELVHACSAHLSLPMWLNEGIAIVTVDRFAGRPTIKQETLEFMRGYLPKARPPTYRELSRMGLEAIAYHGIRGYWLVRYHEKKHPGLLRDLFSQHRDGKTIERQIFSVLGADPENFWNQIDEMVAEFFESNPMIL